MKFKQKIIVAYIIGTIIFLVGSVVWQSDMRLILLFLAGYFIVSIVRLAYFTEPWPDEDDYEER